MGGVLDVRWAHNGIVTTGHYCTAQGIIQQIGEVGVALITLVRLTFLTMYFGLRPTVRQFLAVHTFVAALWQVGLHARGVALGMVCLACIFITLWVAIGAKVHHNYETPTPVRHSIPFFSRSFLIADATRVSIGAGLALSFRAYVLVVNTSGCGSHYSLR